MRTNPPDGEQSIPPGQLLSAVADEQRRSVLRALDDAASDGLPFETLVDRVADETGVDAVDARSDDHRQRVRIRLHHTHLPKLEDAGLVNYHPETGDVRAAMGSLGTEVLSVVESYEEAA